MQCNEAQELISDYIDARLAPRLTTIFEAHLAVCSTCRDKVDLLNRTNHLFASLPQVEPPIGFMTRLRAHLQEESAKPNPLKWLLLPFQIGVPMQATAVVLIAILAGFLYQKERPLKTSPTAPLLDKKGKSERPQQAPGIQEQKGQTRHSELAQAQRQQTEQQIPAPSSSSRPFGLKNPAVGAGREYSRVGGEQTVDHRLVVRLRTPVDSGQVADDRLRRQARSGSALSQQDVKNLQQARERVEKTGQTQSEVFNIPGDRYEQFKKELAAFGNIESDKFIGPQESQSSAPKPDTLLIVVTIVPSTSPAETGVR